MTLALNTLMWARDPFEEVLRHADELGVEALDLMGPVLDRLATSLGLTPQEKPGLFKQLVHASSRRIEAVDFAFRHDDGQRADELGEAEVVLVGVSRSMKTPTRRAISIYKEFYAFYQPFMLLTLCANITRREMKTRQRLQ